MNELKKKYRLVEFNNGSIISQKKIKNSWKKIFSLASPESKCCPICGHHIRKDKICKFHGSINKLNIEFNLIYGGFYQTNYLSKPLNEFTKELLLFRNSTTFDDWYIYYLLLQKRWDAYKNRKNYNWLILIPTSSHGMELIAQKFADENNLHYIDWRAIFKYNPIKSIKYIKKQKERKEIVEKKYQIKDKQILLDLHYGPGIVMDDIYNTGMTMTYIIKLILDNINAHKKMQKLKLTGLVLARTKSKKLRYLILPKKTLNKETF